MLPAELPGLIEWSGQWAAVLLMFLLLLSGGGGYFLLRRWFSRRVASERRKLEILYSLAESLLDEDDPQAVQCAAAARMPELAGATHCFIWSVNEPEKRLEFAAGNESPAQPSISFSAMSGAVACVRKAAALEVPDAENCPFIDREAASRLGRKALLYTPILIEGVCAGVIEVEDRRRKRLFTPGQKKRAENAARLCALALRAARQRATREDLQRAEKFAALGEVIEDLSRQVLEPLGRVQVLASVEPEEGESGGPPPAARLETISREVRSAAGWLEKLAGFVRSGGPAETFDLNSLLRDLVQARQPRWREIGLKVELDLPRRPPEVTADRRLERVLAQVLDYAEAQLLAGGRQTLEIGAQALERCVLVWAAPGAGDSFPAAAERPRAPEVRRRGGLFLCQSLMEAMGGSLKLDAGDSRGFSIELRYPLARKADFPQPSPVFSAKPATVLILDNDPRSQEALLGPLAERGCRAVPVSNVEEALDLCERMEFDWVFCEAAAGGLGAAGFYERTRDRIGRFVLLAGAGAANGLFPSGNELATLRKPVQPGELNRLLDELFVCQPDRARQQA